MAFGIKCCDAAWFGFLRRDMRAMHPVVEAIFVKRQLRQFTLFVEIIADNGRSALGRTQDGLFARF